MHMGGLEENALARFSFHGLLICLHKLVQHEVELRESSVSLALIYNSHQGLKVSLKQIIVHPPKSNHWNFKGTPPHAGYTERYQRYGSCPCGI